MTKNWNRITYLLGTMAVLAAVVACVRQQGVPEEGVRTVECDLVISARQQVSDPETRTILVDNQLVRWLPADDITVFSAGTQAKFTSTNSDVAAEALFTGTTTVYTEPVTGNAAYIWALYPHSDEATYDDGTITSVLPASQLAAEGTFADDLMAGIGRSVNPFIRTDEVDFRACSSGQTADGFTIDASGNLQATTLPSQNVSGVSTGMETAARTLEMNFDYVTSGIRFTLTQSGIETVTLTSVGGEPLAGTYTVGYGTNGSPAVLSIANPSSSITLVPPSGETFKTGVWYYFITLPGTFSRGLTFTLTSGSKEGSRTYSSAMTLRSGAFKKATGMDSTIVLEEQEVEVQVAGPDTWVAVDELHRSLPTDVRDKRTDRQVILFYSSWHCEHHANYPTIVDITGVQGYQGGIYINDYNAEVWGKNHGHDPCFWGTPLFGYYRTTDRWVMRKHAEMLADAGVDAVIFDCTNGSMLWEEGTNVLMQVWTEAQNQGVNVPKICFLLPFGGKGTEAEASTLTSLRRLWTWIYRDGNYSNLWYYVDGKPLIMAYDNVLTTSSTDRAIKNKFTFRPGQPDYVNGGSGTQWGWLEVAPQHLYNEEEMTVGVAQNASETSQGHCYAFNSPGTYGRSYTKANGHTLQSEGSYIYGYNFQEQWNNALAADPKYVFVTGWNEWTADRQDAWPPGQPWPAYPNAFPDEYDSERSRDIEPNQIWGDHGDNYYYQMIQNIRRYKGIDHHYPNVSKRITVDIDGQFGEWASVSPDFRHYPGNTMHRNHPYQSTREDLVYVNETGRNDIVDARVARDKDYVYFYVETAETISTRTGAGWMRLFINIDRDITTGWKGYDFCLNYKNPESATRGILSKCTVTTWNWEDEGYFDYAVSGNKMEIRVPRTLLGVGSGKLDFEFKWSDNMQQDGKILDFYENGDCAPGGRFNFHYKD